MYRITPINISKQRQVIDETLKYLQIAADIFHHPFKPINILFDLSGQASGTFSVNKGIPLIRYNPYTFAKYFCYSLANTVPHEVSHYVIYSLYGPKAVRPHGREWKNLMLRFGVEPNRTNSLDLKGIPSRRQNRHKYRCNCTDHQISSTRHNRILNNKARYLCRLCNGKLRPAL